MVRYLMACKHIDNATIDGQPGCAICGCTDVAQTINVDENPTQGLEGRQCQCPCCGEVKPSAWTLPFFKYRPDAEFDSAYDGCYGWD